MSKASQAPRASDASGAAPTWPDTLLTIGGEMGRRIHTLDWAATSLGPLESWPQSLRTMVSTILVVPYPMFVMWGPDQIILYNDAYRPMGGARHPSSLGRALRVAWPEVWDVLSPLVHGIMASGTTVPLEDTPYFLERFGFLEETYFNIVWCGIRDESGGIGGLFGPLTETTSRVLAERRIATLSALGAEHAATAVASASERVLAALATNASDIPFALLYLLDEEESTARLAGSIGLDALAPESAARAERVDLVGAKDAEADAAGWPLAQAWSGERAIEVSDLEPRFGAVALPGGPWPEPARTALVLPLASSTRERPAGALVLGVSPRLPFDDAYRQFFTLAAGQIAAVIANAQSHEAEHQRAEALAALDRAKTSFFSNVSHEFRTPLTLLLGPLEQALARQNGTRGALPAATRAELEIAYRNALRLLKLVNTLLDFARIGAGRVRAAYEPVDLAAFTAELAAVFRSAVERAGLRLVVECPPLPKALGPVYVDRAMWEQIVLNLISNAFKFTFAGEIRVTLFPAPVPAREGSLDSPSHGAPTSRAGKWAGGAGIALTVSDTGTGIPANDLPHIFERFHRVENAPGRTHEGSGIGLALVHDLVALHGGTVEVASLEGAGSTFTVRIPAGAAHLPEGQIHAAPRERSNSDTALRAAPFVEEALRWLPDEAGAAETANEGVAGVRRGPHQSGTEGAGDVGPKGHASARILLVEDNADMRAYAGRLLGEQGWTVETASDGAAALAGIQALPEDSLPDLVLADIMLPGMDGFALLRALRGDARTRGMPVVLLSARAGEEARVEGLEAGADDYLVKPFAARELVARVRAHLELARLRAQLARERAEAAARELVLAESARRMEEFLTRASHELRTPLTSLKMNVDLLARPNQTGEREMPLRASAQRQMRRMERLVNDMIDHAQIQEGHFALSIAPVDLATVVREAAEDARLAWPARTLRLDLPGNMLVPVHADADRLTQVLAIYLTNAFSYSDADRPVTLTMTARRADHWVRVAVRDEGPGVAPADQQRIWERFERVEGLHHRSGSKIGLGLGLYLAREIVLRHGGQVGVESALGEGSTFWFTLPPQGGQAAEG